MSMVNQVRLELRYFLDGLRHLFTPRLSRLAKTSNPRLARMSGYGDEDASHRRERGLTLDP